MFDIGFWELVVVGVVGLLVLGPERLPVAIRTVSRLFKTVRDTANAVKTELSQELRMDELHRDLKKAEQLDIKHLSPELKESVDQLREAAASVTRPYEKKALAEPSPATDTDTSSTQPLIEPDADPDKTDVTVNSSSASQDKS
ncbi:MAG: Sec-independent protein translocase protein TatB [Candidatus Oceanisphaera merdipullorum]|nr:Sec-independent protein translocase protein TatB [Candidatus Oceanisphaera merdipullorum]